MAGVLVAGCFSSNDGGGCQSPTSLTGNGAFNYVCDSPNDAWCRSGRVDLESSIPGGIVRGARFRLTFRENDDDDDVPSRTIDVVSPNAVMGDGTTFRAKRAGRVGFFVADGTSVVDAIRLRVVEPKSLEIERTYRQDDLLDLSDNSAIYVVNALDDQHAQLAGTFDPQWSVDDPSLATVHPLPNGCEVEPLVADGTTTLRVTYGGASASLTIHVKKDSGDPPPFEFDAGSDADVETDADAPDGSKGTDAAPDAEGADAGGEP